MVNKRCANTLISLFVILWTIIFHYESIRYFYLTPWVKKPLPKVKFLFPPAGWIMFYNVEDSFGNVEVSGVKDGIPQMIDPHDIFRTRTIGFDNIHRGILGAVAGQEMQPSFCKYLSRRFSYFENFLVTVVYYPHMSEAPYERLQRVRYQCYE